MEYLDRKPLIIIKEFVTVILAASITYCLKF